ncbi:hypothetical protein HCJ94_04795 [Micromonospora sp. HSS6-12]|uniref:Uncharacterized protein n=2 Tax=Micromonospora thermarum TaxID=2720024 RepID=A0ABX0Z5I3_9ACTN|nr:hypothetical protein [Micromonospora thermarum]
MRDVLLGVHALPPRRPTARQALNEGVDESGDTGIGDGLVDQVRVGGTELVGERPGVGEFEQGGGQPRVPFEVESLLSQETVSGEGGAGQLGGADPVGLVVVGGGGLEESLRVQVGVVALC